MENSFTSLGDVVDSISQILGWLKYLVLRNHWNSLALIPHLKLPILIVHGKKDELVPYWMGQRLFDSAKSSIEKKFVSKDLSKM